MSTQAPEKQPSPGMRVFRVVAIGCGLIFVAGVAAVIAATFWAFSPGEQVETANIISADSRATVRADDLLDDPGVLALVTHALDRLNAKNQQVREQALPENLRWISNLQRGPQASDYKIFIPKEFVVTAEEDPNDPSNVELVAAANFRSFVRPLRKLVSLAIEGENPGATSLYRDHEILAVDGNAMTFHGGTLLFAGNQAVLERAVDRILDGPAAAANAPTASVDVPPGAWDVRGIFADHRTAYSVLDEIPPGGFAAAPPSEGLALALGIDVTSADEARFESVLECGDVDRAMRWLPLLEDAWERRRAAVADQGLNLGVEISSRGSTIRMDGSVQGLEAKINTFFDNLVQF